VRIFASGLDQDDNEEAAWSRCIEAIQEACDFAARYGMILALENHGGIVTTIEQMLALVREVKHDWFGVNLDTANFHSEARMPTWRGWPRMPWSYSSRRRSAARASPRNRPT
jgi:sugar phosphate isomerase/epimerase